MNHLVPYGCQAYSFIKKRKKLEKLEPRAHIRYLVRYNLTNIFHIWIPSQKTIILTCDVVFDVTKRYNLADD